jgi:CRISPR-associated endonuclease/helicase Cas3
MIGRGDDVDAIARALAGGGNVVLAGPRRTGKTTVAQAALEACRRTASVYVGAVDLFEFADPAGLVRALTVELLSNRPTLRRVIDDARRAGEDLLAQMRIASVVRLHQDLGDEIELALEMGRREGEAPHDRLRAALELAQTLADRDERRVVLFFDEFQDTAGNDERFGVPEQATRLIRAVLQRSPRVSVLFAGSLEHLMRDIFGPTDRALSQFGGFHELTPITADEWKAGIRARLADDDAEIVDDASDRLIVLGEGHPRTTMLLAQHAHAGSVTELRPEIDSALVVQALERAISGERLRHDQQLEQIRMLGRHAETMATRVAAGAEELYAGLKSQQARRGLEALHDRGIIEPGAGRGRWRVVDPLFRRYLVAPSRRATGFPVAATRQDRTRRGTASLCLDSLSRTVSDPVVHSRPSQRMTSPDFAAFFQAATGYAAYDYQRALGERLGTPELVEIPTGAGKTQALLCAWLHQRLTRAAGPRRLVYALPMRSLVEQTRDVALELRERLGLTEDDVSVDVLMGGESAGDWRLRPEHPAILIGTIDMLLSRALARGYGESRFAWPVAFGLLHTDCRWVFDEVQLMGPARATSAQLAGLREALGGTGTETTWVSATTDPEALRTVDHPELGEWLRLSEADRAGPLAPRMNAVKTMERADLADVAPAQRAAHVAALLLERHRPGTRTLCVLNRVDTALKLHARLSATVDRDAGPGVVIVHSRFRPPERAAAMQRAIASVDPDGPGTIVIATQVVEAGVDLSSALLVTPTAPFSSVVQRLGRCNRAGELADARVLWLDDGEPNARDAAPYAEEDLRSAREALLGLVGESVSPSRLEPLHVAERRDPTAILRRRDLIDLFDTSPDLSGLDIDVAPFIRPDDVRIVAVCFRDVADLARREISGGEQSLPRREELVQIPLSELGRNDLVWTLDHVEGTWVRRRPSPGATAILPAAAGRYDPVRGWTGDAKDVPLPLAPSDAALEGIADDPASLSRRWVKLADHLKDVMEEVAALADVLKLPAAEAAALRTAGALHDVGKAHPVFQDTLLRSGPEAEREQRRAELWAKSAGGYARHSRPAFRHELASVLALVATGDVALDDAPLVRYLVAAHHGRVRLSMRPAPDESPPAGGTRFALGIVDGDEVPSVETPVGTLSPVVLDLGCMELGGEPFSWTDVACALRDRVGPLRLAYLEALLRIADWRVSARA